MLLVLPFIIIKGCFQVFQHYCEKRVALDGEGDK